MSEASSDTENGPDLGPKMEMVIEFAVPGEQGQTRRCEIDVRNCLSEELEKQRGPALFRLESLGYLPSGGGGQKFALKSLERFLDDSRESLARRFFYTFSRAAGGDGERYISIAGVQHLLDNSNHLRDAELGASVSLAFWHALLRHQPAKRVAPARSRSASWSHCDETEVAGSASCVADAATRKLKRAQAGSPAAVSALDERGAAIEEQAAALYTYSGSQPVRAFGSDQRATMGRIAYSVAAKILLQRAHTDCAGARALSRGNACAAGGDGCLCCLAR